MSAAAHKPITTLPEIKQRSWATLTTVLIDVVALELSLFFGCLLRLLFHTVFPISLRSPQYSGLALGVLTVPLVYYYVGLYPGYGMGAVERLRSRAYATLTVFLFLLAWNYAFQDRQWSRGVLLDTMFFALIIPPLLDALLRKRLIASGICGVPVVILGGGDTGTLIAKQLQKNSDLGFVPVGILDDDRRKQGVRIHGVPVLGPLSLVKEMEGRAKVVLLAMPNLPRERLTELVQTLSFPRIIVVPDLVGMQSLWITSRDLGGILGLEVRKNLLIPTNRILKRTLDYAIAAPLSLLTLPLLAIAAAWIQIVSPGPALFRQQREGEGGLPITVYKLRTMYPHAERILGEYLQSHPEEKVNWHRFYKLKEDPRVIPVIGWFSRRYSLDELPQLWNVLRGDMSLVGPRPFPFYHLDSFPPRFRALRTSVTPGLTGLWQVSERSEGDVSVQERQDTYYIRNWSLWLDILILLQTIRRVLRPQGAY